MTGSSSIDISLTNIWRSWQTFRQGKKPSRAIVQFEAALEAQLLQLCLDLNTNGYVHGSYDHKIVNEKKRRDIAVASVRDRVVHRLLYDYLVPILDKRFDYDVWSCRAGKGLHQALDRTRQLLAKHPTAWVWRADIRKFFDSVPHSRLNAVIERNVDCPVARHLLDVIVSSYETGQPGRGLPIGNLTSQILANLYLNEIDRFIRTQIKPLEYLRYGDDFIILFAREHSVHEARELVAANLADLGLVINDKQDIVVRSWRGLHFLGHVINGQGVRVERKMARSIRRNVSLSNITSYRSLLIDAELSRLLPWLVEL